ncbi:decoration protein [Bacillus phage 031MP002]|nr:decoration protein [Bacillus phage 031MP003]QFG05506.1 decoration protein [Bacillus phage 031MP002]
MNLQPRTQDITVQREFLFQTSGLIHKVGNVTLDASQFTAGVVKAGTVVVEGANGLSTPYNDATFGTEGGQAGTVYVTANDVEIKDGQNVQIGAIEEAFLRADRITNGGANLEANSGYRYKLRG